MSKKAKFATKFRRAITMALPAQIIAEYYYSGCKKHRAWPSGADIYIGEKRGTHRCVGTIEALECGSLRVVFRSDLASDETKRDEIALDVENCSEVTPWFEYEDRLMLAQLVDARIRMIH
jgi:hypothetical protein